MENENAAIHKIKQSDNGTQSIVRTGSIVDLGCWSKKMSVNYRVNDVIKFHYNQPYDGGYEKRYGKIVTWRRLTKEHIERLDRTPYRWWERGVTFNRVGVLLTVEHVDGIVKNYYTKQIPLPPKGSKLIFKIMQIWNKVKN